MFVRSIAASAALLLLATVARADLEPWKDYDISEQVWQVTTIKVHSNMGDAYLEGLKNTWVTGMETSKKLGQIEDYFIYRSELPESGDFNLMLVVRFADNEALAPNQERYEAFMKEFGEEQSEKTTEYAQKNYPGMREITGEYRFRRIDLK
jgi:hypothetical protein